MLSPLETQKAKVLEIIEIVCRDDIKDLLQKLKDSKIEKINQSVLSDCAHDWKRTYKNLGILKNSLMENRFINLKHLNDLSNLLESIAVSEASYTFPVFDSDNEINSFFGKLFVASSICIEPCTDIAIQFTIIKFNQCLKSFNLFLNSSIPQINIYDQIVANVKRLDTAEFGVKMFGKTFYLDERLIIEASDNLSIINIVYLDTIYIPIEPNSSNDIRIIPLSKAFSLLFINLTNFLLEDAHDLYLPAAKIGNYQERILFMVDFFHHNGLLKGKECRIAKAADFIKQFITDKAGKIELISSDESSYEIRVSDGKFMRQSEGNENFNLEVECLKGMKMKITLVRELGPLYDSLNVDLTIPGTLQLKFLHDHLKNLSSIYRSDQKYYAAFSGLIQSSGFGKTKLCLDLLKDHPGIYFVFRKDGQTGVPRMAKWMTQFLDYVKGAEVDDLAEDSACANDSTPGRFLIALKIVLETYKSFIVERITANVDKSDILDEICLFLSEGSMLKSVQSKLFSEIRFDSPLMTFSQVTTELKNLLESISDSLGEKDFPFLLFLDELDIFIFGESSGKARAKGLNIVRRALHCLDTETLLFTLAIGTNSDALDYTPEINDNSLRDVTRQHILPPFILSGNWDIFSTSVPYKEIIINQNLLTNPAMFNVLASFGRPLWSSCRLDQVVAIAKAKLKNGSSESGGALLALLLVRGNLSVNVHHTLARTLIRSYMAIVNYVSTDANDMKIGYSSEPILAIAARSLLKDQNTRYNAFAALREFLFQRAVEKGRITEAIFEYLLLFAIDDANFDDSRYQDDPDAAEFPRLICENITNCKSFLLKSQMRNPKVAESCDVPNGPPSSIVPVYSDLVRFRKRYYRSLTLKETFSSLINGKFEEDLFGIIKLRTQEAIVATSHFIQLESARKEDFGNIPRFPGVKAMKNNVIDLAILRVGTTRQLGFTMPPNYFGIDFILPISIKRDETESTPDLKEDLLSFIAVQSKSSKPDITECTFKMSAVFHLCRCPNERHLRESDCVADGCKAYFKMKDLISILDDQVVILLTSSGTGTRDLETTLSLKGRRVPEVKAQSQPESESEAVKLSGTAAGTMKTALKSGKRAKTETTLTVKKSETGSKLKINIPGDNKRNIEQSLEAEIALESEIDPPPIDQIIEDACENFGAEVVSFEPDKIRIKSVNFPEYFAKNKIRADLQPDIILTKTLSKLVTVQKMCWLYKVNDLEALLAKKGMDVEKSEGDQYDNVLRKRSLTCISINNIDFLGHLIGDEKGVGLLKEIIEFSASNFQNVEPIHKPIVQNSMLNGIFSPYYECNPMIQTFRGDNFPLLDDPLENYQNVFTSRSLDLSIKASIIGSVNKPPVIHTDPQSHRVDYDEEFERLVTENYFEE